MVRLGCGRVGATGISFFVVLSGKPLVPAHQTPMLPAGIVVQMLHADHFAAAPLAVKAAAWTRTAAGLWRHSVQIRGSHSPANGFWKRMQYL